jgi:hypothetical protein
VKNVMEVVKITGDHKPGDTLDITYHHLWIEKTTKLTLTENPALEIVSIEKTGGTLTPAMQNFRASWLGSQVKSKTTN